MKARPDEVKFMMVDPKMVELLSTMIFLTS